MEGTMQAVDARWAGLHVHKKRVYAGVIRLGATRETVIPKVIGDAIVRR